MLAEPALLVAVGEAAAECRGVLASERPGGDEVVERSEGRATGDDREQPTGTDAIDDQSGASTKPAADPVGGPCLRCRVRTAERLLLADARDGWGIGATFSARRLTHER